MSCWNSRVQGYSKLVGNFVRNCAIKERANRLSTILTGRGEPDEEKAAVRSVSGVSLPFGRKRFCGKGQQRKI
jgi:hypothetical protein